MSSTTHVYGPLVGEIADAVSDYAEAVQCPDQGRVFVLPFRVFDHLTSKIFMQISEHNGLPYFPVGKYIIRRDEPFGSALDKVWESKRSQQGN